MALYHKHRPQTFESVVGQEHIIKTITNQILTGNVSHAYLFCGPRGVGKTTTARLLAKSMNCTNRTPESFEPCDMCDSCLDISKSRAIDVIEIDAASNTGVDNVRTNIIDNAQFQPTKSKNKIFIIDEVHMLSTSAFNALLKIMEEPPTHVMFILATTELHKLPDTIVSRCQRFDFKRLSYGTMKEHLTSVAKEEGITVDSDVLDRLIRKSDGCARDGVSLLDQLLATGEKKITADIASVVLPISQVEKNVEWISSLIHNQAEEGLALLNTISEQDADMVFFATESIELLRLLMILKVAKQLTLSVTEYSEETTKCLQELSAHIDHKDLITLLDLLLKRKHEIRSAPIPQLPLEMVTVEWCYPRTPQHAPQHTTSETTERLTEPKTHEQAAPENTNTNSTALVQEKHIASLPEEITERHDTIAQSVPLEKDQPVSSLTTTESEVTEISNGPAVVPPTPSLTLEEAMLKWNAVITSIEQSSPSLVFILKGAQLIGVEQNTLTLGVAFSFHQDKLTANKTKFELEAKLSEVYERPMKLDVVVREAPKAETNGELDDLAAALGGEVVA